MYLACTWLALGLHLACTWLVPRMYLALGGFLHSTFYILHSSRGGFGRVCRLFLHSAFFILPSSWRGCSNSAEPAGARRPQTNASWKYDNFIS